MHYFRYSGNRLYCEGVALEALAKKFGTPLYVYSQRTLTEHFQKLDRALGSLDHLVCFAMKSNSNRAVLKTLADLGGGFDVVSEGELRRAISAGARARDCVFAGVGKTEGEIEYALRAGVYSFNVESEPELKRIERVAARLKKVAPVAARVNPNVDAGTHAKITTGTYENKFGIAFEEIEGLYARAAKSRHLRLRGLQMHIGSQLTQVGPFERAVKKVLPLVERLKARHGLEFFSIGGGLGIVYEPALESGPSSWWKTSKAKKILTPAEYAARLAPMLARTGLRILIEPGRFISGNAGILVTRVEYVKRTGHKNFLIVDAAMNDLIRPSFYDAFHQIALLRRRAGKAMDYDVVGPICESGDYFAKGRRIGAVGEGDYIALLSAGAYGSVMASNYNTRPIAAEVLVSGKRAALVKERQPVEKIWAGEKSAPWQR